MPNTPSFHFILINTAAKEYNSKGLIIVTVGTTKYCVTIEHHNTRYDKKPKYNTLCKLCVGTKVCTILFQLNYMYLLLCLAHTKSNTYDKNIICDRQ